MRLVFAGTPEFAERALARLLDAGHDVVLVLTQPDRPAGRGLRPAASAVKRRALARGIEVFQPPQLRDPKSAERVRALAPDALVVAAYGLILPPALLEAGRYGALNIHASLLPRWRGAAPIQRAILAGDKETGISIMRMDAGLDTGPVLSRRSVPIHAQDDAGTLHDRLAQLGAEMIVATLADLEHGRAYAQAQPRHGVTHAAKIGKAETHLDWARPALELERRIRALRPAPGANARLNGEPIKVWGARLLDRQLAPGQLTSELVAGCGEGALQILELQLAGGKRLCVDEYLRGHPLPRGARLT